jgi:hypothetical protein
MKVVQATLKRCLGIFNEMVITKRKDKEAKNIYVDYMGRTIV